MRNFVPKLVYYPNPKLFTKCNLIDFSKTSLKSINQIVLEMKTQILNIKGFYENNCIGMSANQIGYDCSLFIISKYPKSEKEKTKFYDVFINAEIVELSKKEVFKWEGCISDRDHLLLISRPEIIKVKFYNIKGELEVKELSPIKSRICQHEMDHINGIDLYSRKIIEKVRIKDLETNSNLYDKFLEQSQAKGYLI